MAPTHTVAKVTGIEDDHIFLPIILPVFLLYECETWPLILKEEHRLRVFENRVLRKISGPKREKVKGGEKQTAYREASWSALLSKYYSGDQTPRSRWVGHAGRIGREETFVQAFCGEL